jgi:hypothetical protein
MQQAIEYPAIHAMLYADTGVGKSTFAATFPKPMLVWCFDPHGKDWPYRKDEKGNTMKDSGLLQYPIQVGNGAVNVTYRDVQHPQGVVRIEYYHDEDIENPTAINTFRYRLAMLHHEYANWKSIVTDSITFMELSARKWEEKVMNPMTKFAKGTDTRQWFAGSTDTVEELVVMRYASLPMNVVICCHIDERRNERSGEILRGPFAPGRLSKRGELSAAFQEQYHMFTARNENGQMIRFVQTINDGDWIATTQIDAPDNCFPHYLSLWANYKG